MIGNCSFKASHYKEVLQNALAKKYIFLTFREFVRREKELNAGQKVILMRHDIDHKLSLVQNFLIIENSLGIKATYFIRMHGGYNPMSFENHSIVKDLSSAGHELGLHYDAAFARLFKEDPENFFKRDKDIFERIINAKISGVSCHEPNNSDGEFLVTDENKDKFDLLYQAYSSLFLKDMKYISDSSARWREGCMCSFIEKEVPRLCILTHPLWWHQRSPSENY
ncbi:hypothetical protein HYT01_00325 [Candidatus Giovannonibacteria bacterium]|nr:hypothetical protein [Candidatus Giovannonibacteria bacterium]